MMFDDTATLTDHADLVARRRERLTKLITLDAPAALIEYEQQALKTAEADFATACEITDFLIAATGSDYPGVYHNITEEPPSTI